MNDPHVKALHYRVVVGKDVDYNKAPPLSESTKEFDLTIEGQAAIFEMKEHYASADEAKAVIEQYLRAWDILAGIEHGPDSFRLKFDHTDLIDRNPDRDDKGVHYLDVHVAIHAVASASFTVHVSKTKYPPFPNKFSASNGAEKMYFRYKAYQQKQETLASMAYFCLTILESKEENPKKRKKVATRYNIKYELLDKLGKLVTIKGDPAEARKAPKNGVYKEFSPKEKEWIITVIKALIRRAGEYAYDPNAKLKLLSMQDFPDLTGP